MERKQVSILTLVITLALILGGPLFAQDWREIPLRDVLSGEIFRISDFNGKPILLESFAVWCPTCNKQQQQIRKLHQAIGDSVISITCSSIRNPANW